MAPEPLPERIALALVDYDLVIERGRVHSSADLLDIAARWTTSDLTAAPDADTWADFDALRAAVFERHAQREGAR